VSALTVIHFSIPDKVEAVASVVKISLMKKL